MFKKLNPHFLVKSQMFRISLITALLVPCLFFAQESPQSSTSESPSLGAFSVSLNVKDLQKSKDFYEKLGFKVMGGDEKKNYLIMKNGNALIGIFQGMFQGNILTFNPGWDDNAKEVNPFADVRTIQKNLKNQHLVPDREADPKTSGPEYIMLKDPDGNAILIDQHR